MSTVPTETSEAVGANVAALRKEIGLTQAELAAKCKYRDPETKKVKKIARPRIAEIESGRFNPTVDTLHIIAKALGVDVADFFPKTHRKGRLAS